MLPTFRAVILDLDGLILDTEPTYQLAWQKAAAELKLELSSSLCRQLSGQSIDQVATMLTHAFGPDFDFPHFHTLSTAMWDEWVEVHGIQVQPGYEILMDTLRKGRLPFLIATNSQRHYAERCLNLAGILKDFPTLVTRDDVDTGKPAPDIHLHATTLLSIPARHCLAVEDSFPGILAAERAGTIPILVSRDNTVIDKASPQAAARFADLDELAHAINLCILNQHRWQSNAHS